MTPYEKLMVFANKQRIVRPFWRSLLFGIKLELKELPKIIEDDEILYALAPCRYLNRRSMIAITSNKVIVLNRGLFGRLSNNSKKQIYYDETSGSNTKGSLIASYIIQVPGDNNDITIRGLWGRDLDRIDAAFNKARQKHAMPSVSHIQEVADRDEDQVLNPTPVTTPLQTQPVTKQVQLDKLQTMLDNGDINQSEYEELKEDILTS